MNAKRGFTLLELVIVIIIIAILAALGFTQYTKVVEKGRTAEAKAILGQLRSAEQAYNLEYGNYTSTIGNLYVDAPITCNTSFFFSYGCDSSAICTATRCSNGTGKPPSSGTAYTINLTIGGAWGGSAGYY